MKSLQEIDVKPRVHEQPAQLPGPAGKPVHDMPPENRCEPDDQLFRVVDRLHHSAIASATLGISPISLLQAWQDWALHLSISPGKQQQILRKLFRKQVRLAKYTADYACRGQAAGCCIEPLPQDRRFSAKGWEKFPFNFYAQSFLLSQQWWHNITTDVSGVTGRHERLVEFYARQFLDVWSPGNFALTNPEVLETAVREGGANFVRGFSYMLDDAMKAARLSPDEPPAYAPGRNVAVSPGKVVYRNQLMELIQYAPATDSVHAEPLLLVPAWIMKYYILDLSPENSLVRYLVAQGFTVFCISWVNPDERYRDIGLEDYVKLGVMAALDAVEAISGSKRIHTAGYCLGGTLLAMAAAAMARDGDDRIATQSMLAAMVDFNEPGELGLFIDESQLAFLEDVMWQKGYLDQWQMAGAFQMLRSQDLIWSRLVRDYLLGQRRDDNDLMAWNTDATRMPYRMHADYLRQLYLNNELARGQFRIDGREVHLEDIRAPVFAVGTTGDHVAPWKSVFKLVNLFDTDVEFVLTSGGHNAGIVSEPGHPRRTYRKLAYSYGDPHPNASDWQEQEPELKGSWWPEWSRWLKQNSSGSVPARDIGSAERGYPPLCDAPGTYVKVK
ncbi:PHA/PHB synthase family protein [Roseibium salinum]|uniref:Alpha/beta fold hydrolase n=1 Tax=Roseibium salinum TaxID=1604349 RepID=A0ABT3QX23_9HYPH|nr:alpha/beta fold hydrolase [Roseibium sp. DSM 29163]MCX2721488.1 alpha/beta fold hydrolase [Roseibium sp. DSM 29163]